MKILQGTKMALAIVVLMFVMPALEMMKTFDLKTWVEPKLCAITLIADSCTQLADYASQIYMILVGALLLVLRAVTKTPMFAGLAAALGGGAVAAGSASKKDENNP